uniref:Uncharacterized protein n=1 Tax=Poecilia formosa TaxID=48698 RepID=A0A096MBW1_POEFO
MTRTLLDSSWMRFGPAGDGLDGWKTGRLPTQEQQINTWPDVGLEEDRGSELALYICLPIVSVFLLALLAGLAYQRWFCHKLSLANIIALDVQDADANAEFLASLTRNAERHTSTSSDG